MPRYKYSLVACARWEETQIQEWIEYHRSIGFDHVYLYSNDDDPSATFKAVSPYLHGRDPFVTFRHWPIVGQQAEMYFHFLETFKHETEWFSFLDIDEFFVLRGSDDICDFMRDYRSKVDCLYFHWVIYGNSDKLQRDDGPTLISYPRRTARVNVHTKMLCRSAAIEAALVRQGQSHGRGAFWHFLDNYKLPAVRCRDVLDASMDGYGADFPASAEPFVDRPGLTQAVLERAYIAHFQFKSEADFLRRWRRGGFPNGEFWRGAYEAGVHKQILARANEVYDPYLAEYWYRYTANGLRFSVRLPDPALPYDNVALNKPSWQSSVLETTGSEPRGSRQTGGGNNGLLSGSYGFHTNIEPRPWWIVDLLAVYLLAEVRLYFGTGSIQPVGPFELFGSDDGAEWTVLNANLAPPNEPDGKPLVLRPPPDSACRFVMLRLRESGCLCVDEIEVYGSLANHQTPLGGTALSASGLR
jgi:Glycosyl transferase family 2